MNKQNDVACKNVFPCISYDNQALALKQDLTCIINLIYVSLLNLRIDEELSMCVSVLFVEALCMYLFCLFVFMHISAAVQF